MRLLLQSPPKHSMGAGEQNNAVDKKQQQQHSSRVGFVQLLCVKMRIRGL